MRLTASSGWMEIVAFPRPSTTGTAATRGSTVVIHSHRPLSPVTATMGTPSMDAVRQFIISSEHTWPLSVISVMRVVIVCDSGLVSQPTAE